MIVLLVGLICFLLGAVAGAVVAHYNNLKRVSQLAKQIRLLCKTNNQARALKLLSTYELE